MSLGTDLSMRFSSAASASVRLFSVLLLSRAYARQYSTVGAPADALHVREDLLELLVLVLLQLIADLLRRGADLLFLVRLDDEGSLLLDPIRRVDTPVQRHERVARPTLGVVIPDVRDERAGAVDLGRALADDARQTLDARRADEAHDLLDAELLCAVVDAGLEIGLHPLGQRGDQARLGALVAGQRWLVRKEGEGRVLVGNAGVRLNDRALGGPRGGGCCIASTSFGAMPSTIRLRASSPSTASAPGVRACGVS